MKPKYKFAYMLEIADRLQATLQPYCERIQIAGSLRRGATAVSDIEIVALPWTNYTGLFKDQWVSQLDLKLNEGVASCKLKKIRGGDKAKTYMMQTTKPPIQLDLFIADKINWGLIMAIRTGPAAYSKHIVTQRYKGGALDDNFRVKEGYLWRCSRPVMDLDQDMREFDGREFHMVDTHEEEDFFKHIAGGWIPPQRRRRS